MNLFNRTSLFYSMGYIFKCSKNAFYGLTIHPFDRISKKICGEMILQGLEGGVWIPNHGLFFRKFPNHEACFCHFPNHVLWENVF